MYRRATRWSVFWTLALLLAGSTAVVGVALFFSVVFFSTGGPLAFAAPLAAGANPPAGPNPFVQAIPANDEEEERASDGVFLPPDRTTRTRLETAEKMLTEGRYGESVRYLGSLLDAPEDFFLKVNPNQSIFRSLKGEAARLLAEMPAEGRESYELQFGAAARKLLQQAIAEGDGATIGEVSRRYFYTKAGAEATLLAARHHFDHGRWLAAAKLLERLQQNPAAVDSLEPTLSLLQATSWLRAGHSEKAQSVMLQLQKARGVNEVVIAGKPVKLFASDRDALQWLVANLGKASPSTGDIPEQWAMLRGNPERNAESGGGMPLLNLRWRQRTIADPKLQSSASQLRQGYLEQDVAVLPSMQPLAVDGIVLMRIADQLQAVDFATGKRLWRYPANDPTADEAPASGQNLAASQPQALLARLDSRLWDDTTFGTLSSDGESVFCLEELEPVSPSQNPNIAFRNNRFPPQLFMRSSNRLAALELETEGKIHWRVGGPTGEDEPKLAGAFFLGAPLPMDGRLYALVETRGQEIRLAVLSAKTGQLEWSQQLAFVEETFDEDSRHNFALTPSYADGVLVCPTASGAVVAVDVANRSLLWGYQYPQGEGEDERLQRRGMIQFGVAPGNIVQRGGDRWVDGTAVIADGRVLLTPTDTDDLYCLGLSDGRLYWKQKRGANLYVAGIHDGKVLLVGHHQLNSVQLSDGKAAWKQPLLLPSGASPSGRGYLSAGNYYLPLSTAEVARIEIASGNIEQRAPTQHGNAPGNLIAYRGHVISQSSEAVEVFSQVDPLRSEVELALKQNPRDARALARKGELELHDGRLTEALELLRQSYQIDSSVGTHDLLVESLLSALQRDFVANRKIATELEALIDQKHQRLAYLRLMCSGLQSDGKVDAALEACLKLIDETTDLAAIDDVDPELSVRWDRWIRGRLAQLYAQASTESRDRIDRLAGERLEQAAKPQSAEGLRRFLATFGNLPIGEPAREQLVVRLLAGDPSLECEMLLRRLEESSDPQRSRAATARLAELLREGKHPELSAPIYRRLRGELGDEVCLSGKTGKQIFDELPMESPIRQLVVDKHRWPTGKFEEVKEKPATRRAPARPPQPPLDLEIRGGSGPFYDQANLSLDWQRQNLIVQDGLGHARLQLQLAGGQSPRSFPVYNPQLANPALNYAAAQGSMLALFLGYQIVAFDTQYSREVNGGALWAQDLSEQVRLVAAGQGARPKEVRVPWGGMVTVPVDTSGRPLGLMGPLNRESVCFQRYRELVCADPLTGKALWSRKSIPAGSWLYGDDETLIVAPPESSEAIVLSAIDGQILARRPIPAFDQRMTGVGHNLLVWRTETGEPTLVLMDMLTGDDKWSFTAEPGVKADLIGGDEVGIFLPRTGKFKILRIADGQTIVDLQLKPERSLMSITLSRSTDHYLLITDGVLERPDADVLKVNAYPGGPHKNRVISGHLYVIDRQTGKPAFEDPVKLSQWGLVTGQPGDSPLYVLGRFVQRQSANSPPQNKAAILVVNKLTGAFKNFDVPLNGNGNNLEVQADPAADTVALMFPTQTITLKLSDEAEAAPKPEEGEKKSVLKGLYDAGKNVLKKLSPQPGGAEDLFQDDD